MQIIIDFQNTLSAQTYILRKQWQWCMVWWAWQVEAVLCGVVSSGSGVWCGEQWQWCVVWWAVAVVCGVVSSGSAAWCCEQRQWCVVWCGEQWQWCEQRGQYSQQCQWGLCSPEHLQSLSPVWSLVHMPLQPLAETVAHLYSTNIIIRSFIEYVYIMMNRKNNLQNVTILTKGIIMRVNSQNATVIIWLTVFA